MRTADFDYELPDALVAQEPVSPRDASRLLAVPRGGGPLGHHAFRDLPDLLSPGDLLVANDARVVPARLEGHKESGGRCELLLVERLTSVPGLPGARFRAMGQASKALRSGQRLDFGAMAAQVEVAEGEGFFVVRFDRDGTAFDEALEGVGHVPLPPYIRRRDAPADRERYQTVFARVPGSAAAPTAGLHFTPELLARLEARGVEWASVTLHVGPGTFLPVREEDLSLHRLHEEAYEVPERTAQAFADCRARGGRVVAVGTTAARTLESAAQAGEGLRPGKGRTTLFIAPGYAFRAVDAMITNFHLPRSSLLMLVCGFGGHERMLAVYREAVRLRYRFYSYGDAMLIA
ncbi:MAG: tRNA preQ1(34) S-adenosylmethionine ribosyltransferase-isomerase QueA [Deltaproteobacteria bacterium]|nr:tRNA preQ1(34) S-adenosylmethionine ribosyltransferase-isomerase QueA [Deltaproteobacteria bacterium]